MPTNFGARIPVDPRVVERIQKSPSMSAEQGGTLMESWGGPQEFKEVARLPRDQREVFYAILTGVEDPDELSVILDISPSRVESALSALERRGKIQVKAIPLEA